MTPQMKAKELLSAEIHIILPKSYGKVRQNQEKSGKSGKTELKIIGFYEYFPISITKIYILPSFCVKWLKNNDFTPI